MDLTQAIKLGPEIAKADLESKLYQKLGSKLDSVLDKLDDPNAQFTTADYVVLSLVRGASIGS